MARFVVVEGVFGSWKVPLGRRLASRLGAKVLDPGDTALGAFVRLVRDGGIEVAPEAATHLRVAELLDFARNDLGPMFAADESVVLTRYVVDVLATQRQATPIPKAAEYLSTLPVPDVVVLVKVPPKVAIERGAPSTADEIGMQWSALRAALRVLGWRTVVVDDDGLDDPDVTVEKILEGLDEAFADLDAERAAHAERVERGEELGTDDPR